jgi:hypothetical protein
MGMLASALFSNVSVPLSFTPSTLPGGAVGSPYVQTLTAQGGTPPYSTPTLGGSPPPNTTSAGTVGISFTPVAVTTFSFTVSMTDSAAVSISPAYSFAIKAPSVATATGGTPQSTTVNTNFATALSVNVKDAGATNVEGAQVTFTAPGSGASGTFVGSNVVFTDVNGNASVTFKANTIAGSYSVTTSIPGVVSPPSFSLTNTSGVPGSIVAFAGTPQSATVGTAFATALQASVLDGFGNPVSGVSVTFTAPASGASGTFGGSATVATNASGRATAPSFTANTTAGSYSVAAASGALTPASFSLTNLAGPPTSIVATAGTPQAAPVNTTFGTALKAKVSDFNGNPVPGVSVTFSAPVSGASGAFAASSTVLTDAGGIGTAPAFTANGTVGTYVVTATASLVATVTTARVRPNAVVLIANFNLTNLDPVSVPTLSGWLLIALSALLSAVAIVSLRRKARGVLMR